MILDDVLLLAAPTSRSQAYLQALVAHDMLPGHVVLMGDQRPKPNPPCRSWNPRSSTCCCPGWTNPCCRPARRQAFPMKPAMPATSTTRQSRTSSVPSSRAWSFIPALAVKSWGSHPLARTTVPAYALRGYTNVPRQHDAVLCAPERRPPDSDGTVPGSPHRHGPHRGSSDVPQPPAGADIDHQYDSAIRADLLLRVMRTRLLANGMIDAQPQPQVEDPPYYVIHPVLKHLAVLSLESRPDHA